MSKFKAGDRVWSAINGWGIVKRVAVTEKLPRPVLVIFDNNIIENFDSDGKYYTTSPVPILFHDEVKEWPNPPKPIDWNKVSVDTPVFVRNSDDDPWEAGHFAVFQNGYYYCFNDGKTSFTTKKITCWSRCVLAE